MPREVLRQLQLERLQATLNRVAKNVEFYRKKFQELKIEPEDIKSLDDVRYLPFTMKRDLRDNYPYGMFAVPLRDVVRIHSSTGTTGKPTVVGYTKRDLANWADLCARFITAGGVTAEDVVQISFGYGLFTGGFGLHYGAELIGASVIPASSGNTRRQIMIMQDYKTTALVCTPSYALHIADVMEEMGINPKSLSLKWGLFGAEPWSEQMRQKIQEKLPIVATDNYGLSAVMGPGVTGECLAQTGMHSDENHFLVEIINPDTLEPVPDGELGEIVITTLHKEAFPLIRYRTRDISRIIPGECPCGRTGRRLQKIQGRTDDMLIIRGVNVFPSQIEEVLFEIEGAEPHYMLIVDRKNNLDTLEVQVEVNDNLFRQVLSQQSKIVQQISARLQSTLGIGVEVKLVEPKTLQRFEGKAKRVIDKRQI
jgi:phenylacetate-CoA ligase